MAGRLALTYVRSTVSAAASTVAAYPELRDAILARQRAARRLPGLVADGRDMGTVVFPDARFENISGRKPGDSCGPP